MTEKIPKEVRLRPFVINVDWSKALEKKIGVKGFKDLRSGEVFWTNGDVVEKLNQQQTEIVHLNEENNKLIGENKELKQEKQKIFDYIDKQIRINHYELKLWEKSNNKARKEKQVLIREMNIICLYNLLRDLKDGGRMTEKQLEKDDDIRSKYNSL